MVNAAEINIKIAFSIRLMCDIIQYSIKKGNTGHEK